MWLFSHSVPHRLTHKTCHIIHTYIHISIHTSNSEAINGYINNSKNFKERWKRGLLYTNTLSMNPLKFFSLSQVFISYDSCHIYEFSQIFQSSFQSFLSLWLLGVTLQHPVIKSYNLFPIVYLYFIKFSKTEFC